MIYEVKIGDTILVDGKEYEVWMVKTTISAKARSGQIEFVDPFQAMAWRKENEMKEKQIEMLTNGKLEKVIDEASA